MGAMDPLAQQFARYRDEGDLQALAAVFDALAPRLLSVALHLTGHEAEAEDLVQQTFLLAIERADVFDASRRLEPWLAGVLSHLARNSRRAARRRSFVALPERADTMPDPAIATERRELVAQLRTRIDALPLEQRQALLLQLQHGLRPAAIAEVLGVPAGTVRMRLARGLRELRRLLPTGLGVLLGAVAAQRGLAAVRAEVLRSGARRPVVAGGVASVAAALGVGGSLMAKLVYGVVATLVGGGLFWWFWGGPAPTSVPRPVVGAVPTPAMAEVPAGTQPPAATAPTERDEPSPAGATGVLRVRVLAALGDERWPLDDLPVECWPGTGDAPPLATETSCIHRTDAGGEIVLPRAAIGAWRARLPGVGGDARAAGEVAAAAETTLELVAPAERLVRGIVVDATGAPVAGAAVWIERGTWLGSDSRPESSELAARRAGASGPDGRFVVPIVPRERVIAATHPGHAASPGRFLANVRDDGLRLVLGEGPAALSVSVRLPDGAPAAGALVRLDPVGGSPRRAADGTLLAPRPTRLAHTDAKGVATFAGVARGRHRLVASRWPHAPASQDADVTPFARGDVVLDLGEGLAVIGSVRDANGAPVRAMVSSRPTPETNGHWCECDTREDGSYLLSHQPRRSLWITASRGTDVVARREIVDPPAGVLVCDLVLDEAVAPIDEPDAAPRPQGSVRGRLLAADGMPVAARRLTLEPDGGGRERSCTTAADGTFGCGSLAAGVWALSFWRGGSGIALRTMELRDAERLDLGDVVLPPTAALRVELVHADGAPWRAEPPAIRLFDADGSEAVVEQASGHGGLRVTGDPGTYELRISATDLLADPVAVTLRPDAETCVRLPLRLGRSFLLRFVHDGESTPKPRLQVAVRTADGPIVLQSDVRARRAPTGRLAATLRHTLPFGSYVVEANGADGRRYHGQFALVADVEAPTEFEVPRVP